MERDAGDEMVRELFLDPSTAGDGDDDPLLDQAIQNVEDQTNDNLEQEAQNKPIGRKVDGIIFGEGPAEKK